MGLIYYQVLVDTKTRSDRVFCYHSERLLTTNQLVSVSFAQAQSRLGVIISSTDKPRSLTPKQIKPIQTISRFRLPVNLVRAVSNLALQDDLAQSSRARLLLSNASLRGVLKNQADNISAIKPIHLSPRQVEVVAAISAARRYQRPQLLRGSAGVGKTRIYAQLIQAGVNQGKSAIVLVPTIGLSTQVKDELQNHFSQPIYHFHSQLKLSQRRQIWRNCLLAQEPVIVVGPRSALMLPIVKLGTIIIDEFHDDFFKQTHRPRYHSLHLASCLARAHQSLLLVASATPNVDDYYRFLQAQYPIHHLTERPKPAPRPQVKLAPLPTPPQLLSDVAQKTIEASLNNNDQVLIFHNRRGSYQSIRCLKCPFRDQCQSCFSWLVFHHDRFAAVCHQCQKTKPPLSVCPVCQAAIIYSRPGTKKLTDHLKQDFQTDQQVTIWRFDSDNKPIDSLAAQLTRLKVKPATVIIGTRIISRGLDLPRLATVVIVNAEADLITPDYRAEERFFQNISQLIGRVGRGHLAQTQVIIQTQDPQNRILKLAIEDNWPDFYQLELDKRRQAQLPPFSFVGNIYIRRQSLAGAQKAANRLLKRLQSQFFKVRFYGPNPALKERRSQGYEWIIHAQADRRQQLVEIKSALKGGADFLDLDPVELFSGHPGR